MSAMDKAGASKGTAGYMQTRTGRRPIRVDTLVSKDTPTSAPWSETPQGESKAPQEFESGLAEAVGGEEFSAEKSAALIAQITGASGSGKTTVLNRIAAENPGIVTKDQDEFIQEARQELDLTTPRKSYSEAERRAEEAKRQELEQKFLVRHKDDRVVMAGFPTEKPVSDTALLLKTGPVTSAIRGHRRDPNEDRPWLTGTIPRRKLREIPGRVIKNTANIISLRRLGFRPVTQDQAVEIVTDKLKAASDKPYRERVEVYGIKDGKVVTGYFPDYSLGTYGGGVDPGETPEQAAAREYEEEGGMKLKNVKPLNAPPMVQEWTHLGGSAKQRARAERFRGSRTTFFVGEVAGTTKGPLDASKLSEVKPRPLKDVIKEQEIAAKYLPDPRVKFRLQALQSIEGHRKVAEAAPGIPDRSKVHSIPTVKPKADNTEWDASMALHPAKRRGDHIDLRLVDPKGRAHSWALPAELPVAGKSSYAVRQPTHTADYAMQDKPFELPKGYGQTREGEKVQPIHVGKVEVVQAGNKKIRFLRHLGKKTEEFVLRRIDARSGEGKEMWAFHNATKNRRTQEGQLIPDYKPKYKKGTPENLDVSDPDVAISAKIDGAHTITALHGRDKPVRVYSYRSPKADPTDVIDHTYKMPDYQKRTTPDSLKGTILRTELWFSKDGKAVPVQQIAGLLNSGTLKSRRKQQEMGVEPRLSVIDVVRHNGKDVSDAPYDEKLKIMQKAVDKVDGLELPPMAFTPEEKAKLIKDVGSKKLPHTTEGVVAHHRTKSGVPFQKGVFRPDHDVYVRDVFVEKEGKTEGGRGMAGGFLYSMTPDGPVVGKVGTGFDHKTKKDMLRNPEDYVGRVATVRSMSEKQNLQEASEIKALRAPSFQNWHLDKNDPEMMKEASSAIRRAVKVVKQQDGKRWSLQLGGEEIGHMSMRRPGVLGAHIDEMETMAREAPVAGRIAKALRRISDTKQKALGKAPREPSQVGMIEIDEAFQGMGLSKKLRGEVTRRMPEAKLHSDLTIMNPRVTETYKNMPDRGYDVKKSSPLTRFPKALTERLGIVEAGVTPLYTSKLPAAARIKAASAQVLVEIPGTHIRVHDIDHDKPFRLTRRQKLKRVLGKLKRVGEDVQKFDPERAMRHTAEAAPDILPLMRKAKGIPSIAERHGIDLESVTKSAGAGKDYGPGGKWIHDRAHHIMGKNPDMDKSQAYAISTQQAHAVKKSPKGFRTTEGIRVAKRKYDDPKHMKKSAESSDAEGMVRDPKRLEVAEAAARRGAVINALLSGTAAAAPVKTPTERISKAMLDAATGKSKVSMEWPDTLTDDQALALVRHFNRGL